jgi:cytidylate kinase
MSIIIIASDDRLMEERIAGNVAGDKGYALLDRAFLDDIGARHQVDPDKLRDALETAPSAFNPLSTRQWRHMLACIESGVLERMLSDNIVCWGLAAHLYVKGVSHAMKIRVLCGKKQAVANIAEQKGISPEKAERRLEAELKKRKKWSVAAYQSDETDLSRYDMVINLDQIDPVEAVRTITGASDYRKFQSMTYSTKCLTDLALAARVREVILQETDDVDVQARDGAIVVYIRAPRWRKRRMVADMKEKVRRVDGVGYVEVHVNSGPGKENA